MTKITQRKGNNNIVKYGKRNKALREREREREREGMEVKKIVR